MDKILQTRQTLEALLEKVECGNFAFVLGVHKFVAPYLQIVFESKCNRTKITEVQYCRKWALQYTMTDTEVIRTAYLAAQQASLHEFNEQFKYKGVDIYNPHISIDALVSMHQKGEALSNLYDLRKPLDGE